MSDRIIGVFFLCLMAIPIAQVVADRELGVRRLEIWNGDFDPHRMATSKQHRPTDPGLHLHLHLQMHGAQRTG
jgi:hypothetical protein